MNCQTLDKTIGPATLRPLPRRPLTRRVTRSWKEPRTTAKRAVGRPLVPTVFGLLVALLHPSVARAVEPSAVTFAAEPGRIEIQIGDRPFACYVYDDETIPRPFFHSVYAPNGAQVTRNHPPVKGQDIDDHPTYHPGIWLAFGDINGADFWRNKAVVKHERFVQGPAGGAGAGSFAVENVYLSREGTEICREIGRYNIHVRPTGYFLIHESEFFSVNRDFVFGDQEEMGLGVRVATPLAVRKGGAIVNSDGLRNEKQVWGKQALWCDYGAAIDGRHVGVTLMPHPENFRPSWFHARDYGLLLANPFGRNAFTGGEKSAVRVKKGERFSLRFGVFVYCVEDRDTGVPAAAYQDYLRLIGQEIPALE